MDKLLDALDEMIRDEVARQVKTVLASGDHSPSSVCASEALSGVERLLPVSTVADLLRAGRDYVTNRIKAGDFPWSSSATRSQNSESLNLLSSRSSKRERLVAILHDDGAGMGWTRKLSKCENPRWGTDGCQNPVLTFRGRKETSRLAEPPSCTGVSCIYGHVRYLPRGYMAAGSMTLHRSCFALCARASVSGTVFMRLYKYVTMSAA